MPELVVEPKGTGERSVLALRGELDIATVGRLRQAALAALASGSGPIELDLADLTFLDSSGLGALVELRNLAHGQGRTFAVATASRAAARVIEMAGLGPSLGLSAPEASA